jgi:hypothetical protein
VMARVGHATCATALAGNRAPAPATKLSKAKLAKIFLRFKIVSWGFCELLVRLSSGLP